MKHLLAFTCCFLWLFSSYSLAQDVIAEMSGTTVKAIANQQVLTSLLEEVLEASDTPEVRLSNIRFEMNASNVFLVGEGETDKNNQILVARELISEDADDFYPGVMGHACLGAPCKSCYFSGDVFSGEITGCGCTDELKGSRANHAVIQLN